MINMQSNAVWLAVTRAYVINDFMQQGEDSHGRYRLDFVSLFYLENILFVRHFFWRIFFFSSVLDSLLYLLFYFSFILFYFILFIPSILSFRFFCFVSFINPLRFFFPKFYHKADSFFPLFTSQTHLFLLFFCCFGTLKIIIYLLEFYLTGPFFFFSSHLSFLW